MTATTIIALCFGALCCVSMLVAVRYFRSVTTNKRITAVWLRNRPHPKYEELDKIEVLVQVTDFYGHRTWHVAIDEFAPRMDQTIDHVAYEHGRTFTNRPVDTWLTEKAEDTHEGT